MQAMTKEELVAFEEEVKALFAAGELPFLVHLCGGNENQLIEIFRDVQPGDWVFSTHRSHYHYLLSGGSRERLLGAIKRGDSMFVFDSTQDDCPVNFVTSSVLAGTCCIAAGVAHELKRRGSKNRVWCFLGDGAEEQGHFYEAVMMVEGHGLPCTFIVEDNDRSVDTNRTDRRGGHNGVNFHGLLQATCLKRYRYEPTYPHAGAGLKTHVAFKEEAVQAFLRRS